MCGRFEGKLALGDIFEILRKENERLQFKIEEEKNKKSNIVPTDKILSITKEESYYQLSLTN